MKNKTFFTVTFLVIMLIIFPLLKPGYVFSLDQVLNPNGWVPKIWEHIYWVWILSQVFTFLNIPIWILEKILIIFTFFVPAIWGYYLLWGKLDKKSKVWMYFWIFFLIFNPFLYSRFLDGQMNVYLSYSIYPLFFYFLKKLLIEQNKLNIIFVWILTLLLCLTSIHNAIIIFFILVVFAIIHIKSIWFKSTVKIWSLILLFNLIWIIPFFNSNTDKFHLAKQINNFWINHQEAFKPNAWDSNIYFNLLSLHWYWWENQHRFITTEKINPKFHALFILILLIIITWFYSKIQWKKFKNFEISLTICAAMSFILALWISENNIFSSLNLYLYENLPYYKWMREPQKWLNILIICYVYFWVSGINYLVEKIRDTPIDTYVYKATIIFLVLTPLFYNIQAIWGFSNQISIRNYPHEWKEVKNILLTNNKNFAKNCNYLEKWKTDKCYSTISLPWHWYMGVRFTWKRVWWWITRYFWDTILYSDNLEIANIYTQSTRPESKIIEKYIWPWGIFKNNDNITEEQSKYFIKDMQWLWIKYILILKEADYKWYNNFLKQLSVKNYIINEKENKMLILYKII